MFERASNTGIQHMSVDCSSAKDMGFDVSSDDAAYYRRRAAQHRQLARKARHGIAEIHEELSAAYLAAAESAARGEPVSFDGSHRAEWYQ